MASAVNAIVDSIVSFLFFIFIERFNDDLSLSNYYSQ